MLLKRKKLSLNFIIFNMFICISCVNTEIITASIIGTAIAASGFFGWNSLKTQTYCRFRECCDERYVNFDLESK